MTFDAVSHAGGFGAGQALGRSEAAQGGNALSDALYYKTKNEKEVLEGEIANRWIPYAVKLNASLVARRVQREDLIAELRRLDPANAENVIKKSEQHCLDEFDAIRGGGGARIIPLHEKALADSEEGRLDR